MYSKYFFEKYAQLTLNIAGFNGVFLLSDKPDLQNTEDSIGIEVVIVETEQEGVLRHLFNENVGKGLTGDEFCKKIRNPDLKQQVVLGVDYMALCKVRNSKENVINAMHKIEIKAEKFINYKKFNRNGLYMFSNLWENQLIDLQNEIIKKEFPFDFYVINMMNKIAVLTKDSIKTYDVSNQQMREINSKSLDYEKNLKI